MWVPNVPLQEHGTGALRCQVLQLTLALLAGPIEGATVDSASAASLQVLRPAVALVREQQPATLAIQQHGAELLSQEAEATETASDLARQILDRL